jgi:hypothetical protein
VGQNSGKLLARNVKLVAHLSWEGCGDTKVSFWKPLILNSFLVGDLEAELPRYMNRAF